MSAVPKKKLCWNCDGNVAKNIDNCPYCGVYLHTAEMNDNDAWSPNKEEVPPPVYKLHLHADEEQEQAPLTEEITPTYSLLQSLKQDLLPILFLMAGSLFMLFGIVLLLFAQDGMLTLQWKGSYWIYFVLLSLPTLYFGWKYWRDLEES